VTILLIEFMRVIAPQFPRFAVAVSGGALLAVLTIVSNLSTIALNIYIARCISSEAR
jgi:hypothetical protein